MSMGAVAREAGVLKLVHPGGYVEVHRKPVRASEVMERNPRHFVTRTDVFKFPWIVVRPESVLRPGCVFYVVPCRTLHRLLRSSRSPPPPHRRSPTMAAVPVCSRGEKTVSTSPKMGRCSKPCLKKQPCGESKSRGRRVAFRLPGDHDEEERSALLMAGGGGGGGW